MHYWYNAPVWKKLLLVAWAAALLFPTAWASQQTSFTASIFNSIFADDWVHVVAHGILYAVLAGALYLWIAPTLERPLGWRAAIQKLLPVILIVVGTGVLQESIQILPLGVAFSSEEWFDLRVDLISGLLGMGLGALWLRSRSRLAI